MTKHWILGIAAAAMLAPAIASAQFTTFIAPPNRVKDSVRAAIVAEQKATTDSVTHAKIADMKSWVDSAAGLVIPPARIVDSSAMVIPTDSVTIAPTEVPPNGVRAPHTASSTPLIIVLGGFSMLMGGLLFRRPRLARVRHLHR